jgi:hypothetical protein
MLKKVIAILMFATAATACGASANIGGAHTAFCIGGPSCSH